MREPPELWPRLDRIQWGCALMELLGEASLEHLHVVLSGLRSITTVPALATQRQAITTARLLLGETMTSEAVRRAAEHYMAHSTACSYTIDTQTLAFVPCFPDGQDEAILTARRILQDGLPRRAQELPLASTSEDLQVKLRRDVVVPLDFEGLSFDPPARHPLAAQPRAPLCVTWGELEHLACTLDQEDRNAGRKPERWEMRLQQTHLMRPTGVGLCETDQLDLSQLKHLIGLPGAGKTTLISLLCVLLARRGQRVAVFFPSIETSRSYLAKLRAYGVRVGLVRGRSPMTEQHHANDLAELIAGQGGGGFARTVPGADLYATNCPLPAFAPTWPEQWEEGQAPCESFYPGDKSVEDASNRQLCPAWSLCGRVKTHRELVSADVWLGHVISSDIYVPAHTSTERLRYFELMAELMDLIIFDECDATQQALDDRGAQTLHLTGTEDSVHKHNQQITETLATNRARWNEQQHRYMRLANEFEKHILRLKLVLRQLYAGPTTRQLAKDHANKLLSAHYLLRSMLRASGRLDAFGNRALTALSNFWESAMYQALHDPGANEREWPRASTYAAGLRLSVDEANAHWLEVNQALKRYVTLDPLDSEQPLIETLSTTLAAVIGSDRPGDLHPYLRLLVTVGFTVASYQRLARFGRILGQQGDLPPDAVTIQASEDLRQLVPRSLLSTFSAVRYRESETPGGYEFDHLIVESTPRLLMHRLHEIGRAHVLLMSATSWLPASSEYHVSHLPEYVLAPRESTSGAIQLAFTPKRHPDTGQPLRFSGAGTRRLENLQLMTRALGQRNLGALCELERTVAAMRSPEGRPRKAVLAVNSYEQVQRVVEELAACNPTLGARTRGVLRRLPQDSSRERYILRGQVEALGQADEVDVIVFPIAALGRGVNIVFKTSDRDDGCAAVGSVYFLTRPHPAAGDLTLLLSVLARATEELDAEDLSHLALSEARDHYDTQRYALYRRVGNILARPMSASRLDAASLRSFAANLLVPILQTIGRAMRNRMSVSVFFVDAAWAPHSANEQMETARSSLLVVMRDILRQTLHDPVPKHPERRAIAQALYGIFEPAFENIRGLLAPAHAGLLPESGFAPSALTDQIDLDRYEPQFVEVFDDEGDLADDDLAEEEEETDDDEA